MEALDKLEKLILTKHCAAANRFIKVASDPLFNDASGTIRLNTVMARSPTQTEAVARQHLSPWSKRNSTAPCSKLF
jgi:hypothetical protein